MGKAFPAKFPVFHFSHPPSPKKDSFRSDFQIFYTFIRILNIAAKCGEPMDLTEDKELFLMLKEGNEHAFKALFQKYYSSMCRFADQFLNDNEMAEETVQELFVRIWEKRSNLNIETSVKHYFFRSVRNHCLNQLQHQKIRLQYATRMKETAYQETDPDLCYIEVGLVEKIEKSIDSLPPKRQEIFRLSREKGLKYKEIADELNISVKTVEAQMGLALKHLRDELKEFDNHLVSLFLLFKKSGRLNKG